MINVDDRLITDVLPEIKPNAFAVLMAIAKHLGRNNSCWPNQQTLQKITGLGRDAVMAALKTLYNSNLLIKQERPGYSNIYTINTEYISISVECDTIPSSIKENAL